eukprot:3544447-Rhodomonas_salina.2
MSGTDVAQGLMRISLSEIDGILGEEDEEVQDSVQVSSPSSRRRRQLPTRLAPYAADTPSSGPHRY